MKISRKWLEKFFDTPLPDAQVLADTLTFHVFEMDSIDKVGLTKSNFDEVLDVKVTPNRGHDCLSHRGIAGELSAILKLPFAHDPFSQKPDLTPATDAVSVSLTSPLCKRYIAGYIRNVKVGPSPQWLQERLEAIGQRSINNVVDATNFVMFNTGQPLHAFDAGKLARDGGYAIGVRTAKEGECMIALDGKEYTLDASMLVIADDRTDVAIGIAGVKGGQPAAITESTKDIIIESANFDGVSVRKTAQALKLRTDASARFEQILSPEMAAYGMRSVVDLIQKLAGGELAGFVDEYPNPQRLQEVSVSIEKINRILGMLLTGAEVADVFMRLRLPYKEEGGIFTVLPPWERLDLNIPEDLVEEVARIIGYDKVPATPLPTPARAPTVNDNFYAAEQARERLTAEGYSEVITSVFADEGERAVLNKVDSVRPYLRESLLPGLADALERNKRNKDLLGLKEVKLFEIGTVWKDGKERLMLGTAGEKEKAAEAPLEGAAAAAYDPLPVSTAARYQPFSKYPYIVRDIALWVPAQTNPEEVLSIITGEAGELCVRAGLFDRFEKQDKTSFAFRLIFQSFERTLTEGEANERMEKVAAALRAKGYEIR